MTLGKLLRKSRTENGKTLREVEGVTGISNGYLSQLESDCIKQPSPHHLHRLAAVYGISYDLLMRSAGYVVSEEVALGAAQHSTTAFLSIDDLNAEDRAKIAEYIADLRDAKRGRDFPRERPVAEASSSRPGRHAED